MKQPLNWLKGLSITKKVLLGFGTVILLSAASHSNQPATINTSNAKAQVNAPTVVTKNVSETQSVPFTSTTTEDPNSPQGTSQITTQGVNGSKILTYSVTYTDGEETDRKLVSTKIDKEPVAQVTTVGTYVTPKPKATSSNCDPNYSGACVPVASDVDCAGGRGNGPAYVSGPVYVIGSDIYGLDGNGDGVGCE